MPFVTINGLRLRYELTGRGALLVMVHGSWGDHHNWDFVAPLLGKSLRVLTYDRRGHSESERPAGQGYAQEDVDDLAALIEYFGDGKAHVAGNSFGAAIALKLATQQPERFESLVAHEPPLFRLLENVPEAADALRAVAERVGAVVKTLEAGDDAGGARGFVDTVAFGPGGWEKLSATQRATFTFNASTWLDETRDPDALRLDLDKLGAFPAPALLTHGGTSPPFFPTVVKLIARHMPRAETDVFPGSGHVPHLSQPEEYVARVTRFLLAGAQ
ncbi:MAG TPA: alpha/beta hydrolase [Gemmatimonadaceae bacterium]|nr:alpha/beta hydrolase [Gemmatimonadaceae bacterium]